MRGVHGRHASDDGRSPLFCVGAGAGIGGAPITGVGSPAGELLPMAMLLLLFIAAGVWAFRHYGRAPEPVEPVEPVEPPVGDRRPAAEPVLA